MDRSISQKTLATGGGSVGGGVVLVWIFSLFGIDMPAEVAVAITGFIAAAVAYWLPAKSGRYVTPPPDPGVDEEA